MSTRVLWGLFMYAGLLAGCAFNPSVDSLTGEQKAKLATIQIFHGEANRRHQVIESVSALFCQKDLSESRIDSEEDAIERVKIKALLVGADAVVNTTCQDSELGLLSTCWSLIECSGEAVKFMDN